MMQGRRILLNALAGFAALTVTSSAWALMSVPMGWYLEGNAGSTKLSNKSYPGSSSSSGIGGNANLGYKFMPYLAAEIGYTQYANTTVKNSVGTKAANDKHYSYDFAFKGIVPIVASGLEIFAKVGAGRLNSNISIDNAAAAAALGISNSNHSATGLYVGAGAQYYFTPEFAFVGQWARSQGNSSTGNMDLLSGGFSFTVD